MSPESVVAILSALIAAASAYIAFDQRRMTMHIASFDRISDAETLLQQDPSRLLELHNVDPNVLGQIGVTPSEVLYLVQNFAASEFFHRLDPNSTIELTGYRKNLLSNPRVRSIWKAIIRDRFLSPGPFSDAVDRYIAQLEVKQGESHARCR